MNKKLINILLLLAYCVPYQFLAMYGDHHFNTILLYGFMVICFGVLTWIAVKNNLVVTLVIGNILSCILSYFFIQYSSYDWSDYFKPFSPVGLLLFVTIILFISQVLFIYHFKKRIMLFCFFVSIVMIIIGYFIWTIMIPIQDISSHTSEELRQVQRELAFNYPLGRAMLYIGFFGLIITSSYFIIKLVKRLLR